MKAIIRPLSTAFIIVTAGLIQADTLQDVYELALSNDAQLKAAEAGYRATIETEQQAFAQLLPQVSASASYSDADNEIERKDLFTSPPTSADTDIETETESYTVSLNQTIFDLSRWFTLKSGKAISQQAQAQLAADQQDLIIRVAQAYFNVLRAKDNLAASKAEEKATQRQLEQTQQRYDVGLIAITDVHEARAVFDNTVVQRLTFEGDLGTAYEALTVLTDHFHNNLWELKEDYPVIDPSPLDRDQWVAFALRNNHRLAAAAAATEAALHSAKSMKMEHMPKLNASYSYTDSSSENFTEIGDSFNNSQGSSWGVSLTVPLYSGGGVSSRRRQAYEQYNQTLQTEIDTRRTTIQATRSLHLNVITDVQRVKARARGIVSTRSALEATEAGYEVGTRNIVDVLNARRSLYGSIRDYANSRYDYVINILKLKQQAGTLSPQDVIDLNKSLVAAAAPTASNSL